jgi:hypothetical protein
MNTGQRIATAATELAMGASALTGATPDQALSKQDPEPIRQELPPGEPESTEETPESSVETIPSDPNVLEEETPFTFVDSFEPNIVEQEESDLEEISKPVTQEEIEAARGESVEEDGGIKFENSWDFEQLIPRLSALEDYEVMEEEPTEKVYKGNSNYLQMLIMDIESTSHPKEYLINSIIDVEDFVEAFNKERRINFTYQYIWDEMDELKGVGLGFDKILKLKGPDGDIIEYGKFLMRSKIGLVPIKYTDKEGKTYDFLTEDWGDEDLTDYGKTEYGQGFDQITYTFAERIQEDIENYINDSYIPLKRLADRRENFYQTGHIAGFLYLDREVKQEIIPKIHDYGNRRELDEIAESNQYLKTVLSLIDAINSYPGDEVVDEEYLKNMYEYNKENYDFDVVRFTNVEEKPEKLTKYLLNYVDDEGVSWYEEFLKFNRGSQSWKTLSAKRLVRDLNLLSSGVNIEGQHVQPFGVFNLISSIGSISEPKIMSQDVRSLSALIPQEFLKSEKDFYSTSYGYLYKNNPEFLMVGDMFIAPNSGATDPGTGRPVGQASFVIHTSPQGASPDQAKPWLIDVNVDGDGEITVYDYVRNRFSGQDYLLRSFRNHNEYLRILERQSE